MNVNGEHISDLQQEGAWHLVDRRTEPDGGFKFSDLRKALIENGVSPDASYRGADRMLQRGCKKGNSQPVKKINPNIGEIQKKGFKCMYKRRGQFNC